MEGEQPSSLTCIQASEIFPKKTLKSDDPSLKVPFPELEGEGVEFLDATADATLALSNYRLFISFKDSFLNIPIHLIESVELKELFLLQINCKDARSFRISFDNNEQCVKWMHRLNAASTTSANIEDLFSFAFHSWTLDQKTNGHCNNSGDCNGLCNDGLSGYSFLNEVRRLGFDTTHEHSPWRITDANSSFEVCSTYPKLHVVPKSISDSDLEEVAAFRCAKRFPSIVWRHPDNGAVIARCSQPEVGWLGWRSAEDERLLQAIGEACALIPSANGLANGHSNGHDVNGDLPNGHVANQEESSTEKRVLILDARSYTAAVANRAKGGGCECTEYYPNCDVEFMNLANIHGIRKSFHSVRNLCSGPQDVFNWWSQLEKTNWLQCLSMLFKAAIAVVHAVDQQGKPVVVHCSDGWDRTTQIVALAELLLDPYYRTIEGFKVLVEREWLEFGHQFANRCGHGQDYDENQRCPVFLQWLDCVHQLLRHFPCAFEFNETFLCKLVQHTYSCLFGTFLCNSELQRQEANVKTRTFSVWSLFHPRRKEFKNLLYDPSSNKVLIPPYQVRSLELWSSVYLAYNVPFSRSEHIDCPSYAPSSFSSFRFPLNFSDSNLDMKPYVSMHLNSSKSDGDLLRQNLVKNCTLDHVITANGEHGLPDQSSEHLKTVLNDDVGDDNLPEQTSGDDNSLYHDTTTTTEEQDCNLAAKTTSSQELVSSMSSSAATIIQGESDSEEQATEDTVSDTITFGRTFEEFRRNSRCRQDSSSYEHLAASSSELNHTEDDDSSHLDKTLNDSENGQSSSDTIKDNLTKEKTIQTVFDEEDKLNQCTQTSDSLATLKLTVSSMYARYLDNDGLTLTHNDVQDRLRQIEMLYQERLENLHAQLLEERRRRLATYHGDLAGRTTDLNDEVCSLSDSTQSGDQPPSHGSGDESSWIEVEKSDAEPTLWVPDHAVNNCANCETEFWIANRRHHCRNCGLVFCSTCSNHNLPVPNEQLYDPVRVCLGCFEKLLTMKELESKNLQPGSDMVPAVG